MDAQRDSQRERLFFIDFLAYFTGQVNRKELVARFGISEPAATKDLSLYAELAPQMLSYDLRQRCYVYAGGEPMFQHAVDQALFALAGERALAFNPEHAKRLPSAVQESIKRPVPAALVARLTRALHTGRQVVAVYMSLEKGAKERELTPTALIHDGLRWHVRCFDHDSKRFKDYNLTRFQEVSELDRSPVDVTADQEWQTEVDVLLAPHPRARHPETVRWDFDIAGLHKALRMRVCAVAYFLRHWHVDTTPGGTRDPKECQLYLVNRDELRNAGVQAWVFDEDRPHAG